MQIEPPETIHFPIHSLQELQEQRGGLRVSALGSATVPRALAGVFGLVIASHFALHFLNAYRLRRAL